MRQGMKALVVAGLFLTTRPVYALVIVDQLVVAQPGLGIASTISDFDWPLQIVDDFAVTSARPVAVTRIEWIGSASDGLLMGQPGSPALDRFHIRFYQSLGGIPSKNPFADIDVSSSFKESTASNPYQALFEVDLQQRIVLSSKDYFISIVADTYGNPGTWTWFFLDGPTMTYGRARDGDSWDERLPRSYSFRILGEEVPEPGSLVLLAFGLAGLGLSRRSRTA